MGTDLCGGHDRIVSARFSGDGGTKPVEGVVPFVLHSQHRGGQAHGWGRRGHKVLDDVFLGMRLVGLEALVCCQRRTGTRLGEEEDIKFWTRFQFFLG